MVENRHAHFERHRHAGAVDLGEDVIGQVGGGVEILHAIERIWQRADDPSIEDRTLWLHAAIDERLRIVPSADQTAIAIFVARAEQGRSLVHLLDSKARSPLRWQ